MPDSLGNEEKDARTFAEWLQQGKVFNIKESRQALQNIHSLGLFSHTEVLPSPNEKNVGGLVVEIKLKEMEPKSADIATEWSIVPGGGGIPTLNDLGFQFEYIHPYLDGLNSPLDRTLRTSCFKSTKLSPVFTGGPGLDEVSHVLVDRTGIKTNITEVDSTDFQYVALAATARHFYRPILQGTTPSLSMEQL